MTNGRIEIQLGGQLRTLRFNNFAKEELGHIYGVDPLEGLKAMANQWVTHTMRAMANLAYAGLIGAYEYNETPIDFTKQDVTGWVADAQDEDIAAMFNTYIDHTKLRSLLPVEKKKGRPRKVTWADVKDFAIGEMGLTPTEFYRMTWTDYSRASQGYWIRNARYLEGIRKLAFVQILSQSDPKKSGGLREDKIFSIITDPVQKRSRKKPERLSPELFEAIKKRYKLN